MSNELKPCPMPDCGDALVGTGRLPCGVVTVGCGRCGLSVPATDEASAEWRWNQLARATLPAQASSAPDALERAAQACDQQADGTNGAYRTACLQCANAVRELWDAASSAPAVATGGAISGAALPISGAGPDIATGGAVDLAEQYSDMIRKICFEYSAGGYNSEGLLKPEVADAKLRWIIDDAAQAAAWRSRPAPTAEEATGGVQGCIKCPRDPAIVCHYCGWDRLPENGALPAPVPSQPTFNQAEFNAMVERGTKAWAGTPDGWVDDLRGEPTLEQRHAHGVAMLMASAPAAGEAKQAATVPDTRTIEEIALDLFDDWNRNGAGCNLAPALTWQTIGPFNQKGWIDLARAAATTDGEGKA